MSIPSGPATSARLWRRMSADQKLAVSRAFWSDDESEPQQVEAIVHIARQMKFRAQFVQKLPVEKRIRYLATVPGVPESVAGRALVAHHLTTKRPMLKAFLDQLGIAHEEGLISSHVDPPSADRLAAAAEALAATYPAEDVHLYLATLLAQDAETWGALEGVLHEKEPAEGR